MHYRRLESSAASMWIDLFRCQFDTIEKRDATIDLNVVFIQSLFGRLLFDD